MVETIRGGDSGQVCCARPMELLAARTADQGKEKHVPVIEKADGGIKVAAGEFCNIHGMWEVK